MSLLSSNFMQRTIVALIGAPLVIGVVVLGGVWFNFVLVAVWMIMLLEFATMTTKREMNKQTRALWFGFGLVYVSVPVAAFYFVRNIVPADDKLGMLIFLWMMVVVWATDIAAYLCGRAIGGPKLMPRVSPKKTWAGLAGGIIAAAFVGKIFAAQAAFRSPEILFPYVVFSASLAVIAQAGDLTESGLKRYFGVKDSGAILPGHGGLLDRLDGLMFAAIAVAMYFYALG